jgi:methylated-DNA-[protein]-cysteine S-methyltransferase
MTVSAELDRRFRDAAAAEGLLDVAYELHDTPVGRLLIAVTEHGVCEIHYDADPEAEAERLAHLFGSRVLRSPRPTDEARRQLDEYFAGTRREFDLRLAPQGSEFQRRVWDALREIPYGETESYGELAARIGRPGSARAVGAANGQNPICVVVPCHRVIGAGGSLTGYAGGLERKRLLLDLEMPLAGAPPLSRASRRSRRGA